MYLKIVPKNDLLHKNKVSNSHGVENSLREHFCRWRILEVREYHVMLYFPRGGAVGDLLTDRTMAI